MRKLLILAVALAITAVIYSQAEVERRPNVILVTIDCLRADHLSTYGYGQETAPYISWLAGESTVYENAYSQAPWTSPSLASIHTSLYPSSHMVDNRHSLNRSVKTLAQTLKDEGYRTGAYVDALVPVQKLNIAQGFDRFVEGTGDPYDILRWAGEDGKPFFLWIHYLEPHDPYQPKPEYYLGFTGREVDNKLRSMQFEYGQCPSLTDEEVKDVVGLYDGEIRWADSKLENVMKYLKDEGALEDALVVVTADHGEEFYEHGGCDHGDSLYNELLHVPLIIKYPKWGGGKRVSEDVMLIDVAPTILEAVSIKIPDAMVGKSLKNPGSSGERIVFSEATRYGPNQQSVIIGDLKLVRKNKTYNVFDLAADPSETRDVYDAAVHGSLVDSLDGIASESRRGSFGPESVTHSKEQEERLKSLGYL